jgi:hypothetical protein
VTFVEEALRIRFFGEGKELSDAQSMTAPHPNKREAPFCQEAVPTFDLFIRECQRVLRGAGGRPKDRGNTVRWMLFQGQEVRYLVDSAAHLGRFYLSERSVDEEGATVWLEGPDGRLFRPSDLLPVLSRSGSRVGLRGADVVLVWLVRPGREAGEIQLGLRYLRQWPEGPQASLTRMER